ncbi:hypothetical protein ACVWYI_006700 [Bradyrhizobium sp. LB13.1]
MVPMLAEACPSRSQIWRVNAATEVLPHGAGHRGDGRGLRGEESCRGQRQRAARIGDRDERHLAGRRRMVADDRHRTCGNRGIDEARTVGLAARKCEEEIARLDHAAVEGNAVHIERRDSGLECGIIAQNILT